MKTADMLEMQTLETNPELATHDSTCTRHQANQIITKLDQVEDMILQGWRLVATLPGERQYLRKSGRTATV